MKISEQSIKNICSSVIYKRGMEYYNQGRVHIKTRENDSFTAVVDGEELFNIRIGLSPDGEITDCFCTCPYYETMGSACKHIVAAVHERRRELEGTVSDGGENERISRLFISDFNRGISSRIELPMEFEVAFFSKADGAARCEVSLYVFGKLVENPEELLECFSCRRPFRLDKNFDYHPDSHSFGVLEEEVLKILAESYESRCAISTVYAKNHGFVPIGAEAVKRLMPILSSVNYKIIIDRMNVGRITILEENPEVLIDISAMLGEITMYVSNYGMALVPDASVFYYEGTIFVTDKSWQKRFLPVYRALVSDCRSQITFKGENALAFATCVLPELEGQPGVVCDGLDEYVIKDKPEFFVYLDYDGAEIKCKIKAKYGAVSFFLPENSMRGGYIVVRDAEAEKQILSCFEGFIYKDGFYVAYDDEVIFDFISGKLKTLAEFAELMKSDLFMNLKVSRDMPLFVNVDYNASLNLLEATPHSELSESEVREILLAVKLKDGFYRAKNGVFYDTDALSAKISAFEKMFFQKQTNFDKRAVPEYNMLYLYAAANESTNSYISCSRELAEYIDSIKSMKANIPAHLEQQLRPYQVVGADWLSQISGLGFGGILADDMGLGKTVQMMAFLSGQKKEHPALIVTPSALTYNWYHEFEKFLPEASVLIADGSAEDREAKLKHINEYEYIIVSYPVLRRDIEMYEKLEFSFCVLDEAQAIKNPQTMNASSVKRIKAGRRFALTGTPIENSLKELWSLFDFLLPGYLGSYSGFREQYELPVVHGEGDGALELLKSRIRPFILRRMKKDVLSELPEKTEEIMYAKMTEAQSAMYDSYRTLAKDKALAAIAEDGRGSMEILTLILRLRQISCHPSLFDSAYNSGSGKLDLLFSVVESAIMSEHRILIFSQFTSMLSIIAKGLNQRNIKYFYIDGSTNPAERPELCRRFNEGENSVFLISLKAGGTGLNLTGADTVIHYDPWWNPAVTDQASDRAYRIGQDKNVHVIRLAAADSVEQKIMKLQETKRLLADDVININSGGLGNLSKEEILSLFE